MMFVTRKIRPKPANLRIEDRSVVARDRSWPDCQSSWKDACSRCRWAYRSSLIDFSMFETAPAWIQRRIMFSSPSDAPRPTAARDSGISRLLSWCAIAPSMTALVSSGMTISAVTAPNAAANITIICVRYGFR